MGVEIRQVSKTQVLVNLFVVPLIALLVLFVVERIRCKGFGLETWSLACLHFGLRFSCEAETSVISGYRSQRAYRAFLEEQNARIRAAEETSLITIVHYLDKGDR